MHRRLAPVVIVLAVASTGLASDTWPQWRGPNRDAVSDEKNLRDHWNDAPPLIWKAAGLGKGFAGPAVASGIVCTVGDRDDKTTVFAVSDKDGKPLWATEIDDFNGHGNNGNKSNPPTLHGYTGAKSTPTIDGGLVYAMSSEGVLVCLKTSTGERVWSKFLPKDFDGVGPEWGYAESPLIDGDKLICTPGGRKAGIVALDKKTGKELWRCSPKFDAKRGRAGASYASAVISHGAGVKQYVQLMGHGLVGISAETGKQLWSYSGAGAHTNPCTPIVRDDYVFAPCGEYFGSALVKLTPKGDGGVEAKEVYFLPIQKLKAYFGGAVLVGDYVYASHIHPGCPQCVEFLTGKLKWQRQRGSGFGPAAVVYADGNLYFRYENGVVALVAATPEKYQLKGKFRLPDSSRQGWAHPAICNGRIYLRQHDALYCYNLRK